MSEQKTTPESGDLPQSADLIRKSGLFDEAWYRRQYPDVALSGLDPAEHFLRFGVLLRRDPSARFDVRKYLKDYPELLKTGVNPLVHYLRKRALELDGSTAKAGRGPSDTRLRGNLERVDEKGIAGWAMDLSSPGKGTEVSVYADGRHLVDLTTSGARDDLTRKFGAAGKHARFSLAWPAKLIRKGTQIDVRFKRNGWSLPQSPKFILNGPEEPVRDRTLYFDAFLDGAVPRVAVVVPIFNAYEAVVECLRSLVRYRPDYAEIILINDASTDPRIESLLEEQVDVPGIRVVNNDTNLGYTRTINKGIALAADCDIVLLNSDTVVTTRWLDSLRYCAYARPRVATVTALSNNAGAFSVPAIGQHNPCPPHLDADGFSRIVVGATSGDLLEVPTGNGFCMYIRRKAISELGAFDEERFPRGYGEENDFCMRALRRGWRNIVSDKSFVLHKRSQSFQGEKDALMKAGRANLDTSYPEYGLLTARFRDVEFNILRSDIDAALHEATVPRPRILFVISTQTGGTPQTNLDLMRAVSDRFHGWLLRCDSRVITLSELVDNELVVRETHALSYEIDPITHKSDEYDQIVSDLLYRRSIELVHIRHAAWHSLNLPAIAKAQNIPVAYSLHDFYTVCPSLNLLDNEGRFCGGSCTPGDGDCPNSLWPAARMPRLKHGYVRRWQEQFGEFLSHCDAYITTARSAADIIERSYPAIEGKVKVIPHGRDFASCSNLAQAPEDGSKIRILVPGNIGPSKGSVILREIAELDVEGRYEFHFLGATAGALKDVGVHHGTYDRAKFAEKVKEIMPAFGLVFSIWAETYCHTLTEMWACGVPVMGMDIGAVGDRIRANGAGWLIDHRTPPAEILKRFGEVVSDEDGYRERLQAVQDWQTTEGRWNDTATMAFQYRRVYGSLLPGENHDRKRLGLLYRQKPYVPATAYIRAILPWGNAAARAGHDVRPVDARWLLSGGDAQVDALLIQRNSVPLELVGELIAYLASRGTPYIYEIDDPLWDLPAQHPEKAAYDEQADSIVSLIRGASVVTTSTEALAARLRAFNPDVAVVANAHSASLWNAPLDPGFVAEVLGSHGLSDTGVPRILYMGTSSHQADLQMIQPALSAVLAAHPDVEFIQVGGGRALPGARLVNVPPERTGYREFVPWLRALGTAMTIAIAPLEDSEFNEAKSDVKLLDYASLGTPAIYSDVGPYRRSVVDGENGLLAQNDQESWMTQVSRLLENQALREQIRGNASAWVLQRRLEVEEQLYQLITKTLVAT